MKRKYYAVMETSRLRTVKNEVESCYTGKLYSKREASWTELEQNDTEIWKSEINRDK